MRISQLSEGTRYWAWHANYQFLVIFASQSSYDYYFRPLYLIDVWLLSNWPTSSQHFSLNGADLILFAWPFVWRCGHRWTCASCSEAPWWRAGLGKGAGDGVAEILESCWKFPNPNHDIYLDASGRIITVHESVISSIGGYRWYFPVGPSWSQLVPATTVMSVGL